ncbi:SAM-dependent methyltransferase [Enemella dayhoffiae]|uniref:SAM-dependent methyltransferase n=1 Tax=Enemella dayhoffiae TaxID=2016507 RepID=A0A255HCE9_9ACTN|nr:class I SAM-dependent methyltransferase [Enemella dayhoffiae]OYO25082.1 SAM-dependent methyltransferase [Enemella dayhoffiae]
MSQVQQAYAQVASRYIELFGSGAHEHADDLSLIVRHLTGIAGPVIDLGCGPGHLTAFLAARGAEVTGIDQVPEFIAHSRRTHPTSHFELGSITAIDRPDDSVAGALAWYSLIHLHPDELPGALAEIRRILRPGGRLVVGFFEGPTLEPFAHQVTTAYRWPVDEFACSLSAAGFEVTDRLQRPAHGERRPHAAVAVTAVGTLA